MADNEPLRNAQGLAVGDINPATGNPVVAIIAAGRTRADRALDQAQSKQEQAQNLDERKFNWQQQEQAAERALREHKEALDQATTFYNLADHMTKMQQDTSALNDAAGFLTAAKDISPNDIDAEKKIAALHAQYPRAGDSKSVQDFHSTFEPARSRFLQTQGQVDASNAEGVAKGTLPGPAMTRGLYAGGLLTDQDLQWHDDPAQRSPVYNPDGSINHEKAAEVAARNQAHGVLGMKGETKEVSNAIRFIGNPAVIKTLNEGSPGDPAFDAVQKEFANNLKVLDEWHQKTGTAAPPPQGAPQPGGPPAPDKPKVVNQGGHTYTLQPDGSYK